jgi:hypothetical protein
MKRNETHDLLKKAICGENRFETSNAAFFKKAFDVRFGGNDATEHGKKYEPIAIAKYKAMSGAKIFFVKFMLHSEYKFLGGTFDGLGILPSGEGVLVEVKCPYTSSIGNVIPEHYIGQVQVYMEIAGLDRCLFIQYKPAYITPGRKFHRPEKLSVLSVLRDPGYFVTRMPILWRFYKRLCAFREGVMPTAGAAAALIQGAWRHTHRKYYPSELGVRLRAIEYRRVRRAYDGVREGVEADMEFSQRPRMPVRVITGTKLVVVLNCCAPPDGAGTVDRAVMSLVVCEENSAVKRSSPDQVVPQETEGANPNKKIKQ